MVGYSLAGRRRCGIFEFRCKKKPRLFKIENNQQQKTIAAVKIILKTLIWRFKGGGGGARIAVRLRVRRPIVAHDGPGSKCPFI